MQLFDVYWIAVWVAAAGSFIISFMFFRFRNQRENLYAAMMMVVCGVWALAAGMKFASVSWQIIGVLVSIEYLVATALGFFYLAFIAELTGYRVFARVPYLNLFFSPALLHFFLHHAGILSGQESPASGFPATPSQIIDSRVGLTSWNAAMTVYAYIPIGIGVVLLIIRALKVLSFYRMKYLLILAASALPLLIDNFSKTGLYPLVDVELAPLLFPVSGMLILVALRTFRALNILPVEYKHLLNVLPSGLLYLSRNRQLVEWNAACEQLLGLNSSHHGASVSDLPFQCLATAVERSVTEECVRCDHPVMEGRVVELRCSALQVKQGFSGFVVYVEDATAKIAAEKSQAAMQAEVKAGRDELDSIFHASSSIQALIDKSGSILRVNKAFLALSTSSASKHPEGEQVTNFFPGTASDQIRTLIHRVVTAGQAQSKEITFDGRSFMVDVHPIRDADGLLLTGTDITQLRRVKWEKEQTEQLHRILITRVQDGIFFLIAGMVTFVNDGVSRIIGYSTEEMIGKDFLFFVHESDREKAAENYRRRVQGLPVPGEYELQLKHRSGKTVDVNMTIGTTDMNGKNAVIGTIKDITVQKKALLALKESEEKYRRIFENAQDVFYQTSMTGTITAISPSIRRFTGYSVLEVVGKPVSDFYYDVEERKKLITFLNTSNEVSDFELRLRTKMGDQVYVSLNTRIVVDDAGNQIGFEGSMRDVTDKRKHLSDLQRHDQLLNALAEGVFMLLKTGDFQSRVRDAMAVLGITLKVSNISLFEACNEMAIGDYTHARAIQWDNGASSCTIQKIAFKGELYGVVQSLLRNEAFAANAEMLARPDFAELSPEPLQSLLLVPVFSASEYFGYICFADAVVGRTWSQTEITIVTTLASAVGNAAARNRDEDKLKTALRQAEELDRLKSSFLANMSHELRTPMMGILGSAEILVEEVKDKLHKRLSDTILRSGNRLLGTLNQLIDISKLEAEMVQVKQEPCDIPGLLNQLQQHYLSAAMSKGVTITLDAPFDELIITTDSGVLRQVLNNLMDNAVKYTHAGSIRLSARLTVQNGTQHIHVAVTDTGIGIDEKNISVIWQEFRQVSEGLSRNYEGTGLGLAIAKKFITTLGGTISVESKVGNGSTFTVSLPIDEVDQVHTLVTPTDIPQGEALPGKPKLLYVENEDIATDIMKFFIGDSYELDCVTNAQECFIAISKTQYDLILMDINLGTGFSGIEATRVIRETDGYRHTPIIAVTAFALKGDKEEFLAAGCSDYISKPFERKQLMNIIAASLNNPPGKEGHLL